MEEEQFVEDEIRCADTPKQNYEDTCRSPQRISSEKIALTVKGLGHCPSFKNNKLLVKGHLITDPKKQKWMKQAIQQLQFQLRSICPTTADETSTAQPQQSSIALLKRLRGFDDCRQWVPELHVKYAPCEIGEERVEIVIEEIIGSK